MPSAHKQACGHAFPGLNRRGVAKTGRAITRGDVIAANTEVNPYRIGGHRLLPVYAPHSGVISEVLYQAQPIAPEYRPATQLTVSEVRRAEIGDRLSLDLGAQHAMVYISELGSYAADIIVNPAIEAQQTPGPIAPVCRMAPSRSTTPTIDEVTDAVLVDPILYQHLF